MSQQKEQLDIDKDSLQAFNLLKKNRFSLLSFMVVVFSLLMAVIAVYIGGTALGDTVVLISACSVMGLAIWVLFYAQSGNFIKCIAIGAVSMVMISQCVNIIDEFDIIHHIPYLSDRHLEGNIKRITLVLGIILFIVALYLAVVESGIARVRLKLERNFLSRVMGGTSTLICVVRNDGTISYINKAVADCTGYSAQELLGRDWWEFFSALPLSDDQKMRDFFAHEDVSNCQLVLQSKDQDKRYISWSSNNRYDSNGALIESFRFGKDITEFRAAEETRERLATAIEQSQELVAITDAFGMVEYVNPAFLELTKYPCEEILGQPLIEAGNGQYTPELLESLQETLLKGQVWRGHLQHSTPDNRQLSLNVTVSPIHNNKGSIKGFVATYRDVSHETELESQLRQAQKMQAIGTLAGGVAHDFNNILSPIIGYTEMVMHELPRESVAYRYMTNIMDAGLRAKELVKQILTFSRQTEVERRPVRLAPVLREAMKLVRGSLPVSIEIHDHIQAGCPPVLADPTQMHQVLMNLCTNAYHAMEKQGGILTVSLQVEHISSAQAANIPELKSGDYCCLSVADTGPGIDESIRHRIFEPYFTTKKDGQGLGLGLATVHGIVRSHGGTITIDSHQGEGATFRVYLPIVKEEPAPETKADDGTLMGKGEKILLVDDEFPVLQVTKRILNRLGYEVVACSSPIEAVELFRKEPAHFHVVLTDLSMPKMNGISLAKAVHSLRPEIPVVLCTGFNSSQLHQEAVEAGIYAIAPKPLTRQELGIVVQKALSGKESTLSATTTGSPATVLD